jgi:hypothetical protein
MPTPHRDPVLDSLTDFPCGTHACQFYRNRQDLIDAAAAFVDSGIKAKELCVWVTPDVLTADETVEAVRKQLRNLNASIHLDQLEVFPRSEWVSPDGGFQARGTVTDWERMFSRAREKGYVGVRILCDTMWSGKEGRDTLRAYENAFTDVAADRRPTILCAYPLETCGGNDAIDIMGAHDIAFVRRGRAWQTVETRGDAWSSKLLPGARSLKDHADGLDDLGRQRLDIAPGDTGTMGRLLDDLAAFPRFGSQGITRTDIDMTAIARDAWEEIHAADPGRRPSLVMNIFPSRAGDEVLMRKALHELLSNAAKFSRVRENPVVEVGALRRCDTPIYYVRDNGVGFDRSHAERIFGLFQRLHGQEEFEGTGMGLAIVDRIVRLHGGVVRGESEPDKGTAFYFTLPDRD